MVQELIPILRVEEDQSNASRSVLAARILDSGGRAQRRHRFKDAGNCCQSGVALRFPPHSKEFVSVFTNLFSQLRLDVLEQLLVWPLPKLPDLVSIFKDRVIVRLDQPGIAAHED
jgi:hypothetical protein